MRFQLLGPLAVAGDDGPLAIGGPKQRLVLAHLLLRVNETVPAETLIDAVWGEEPPETARGTLQAYVSRLRGQLGAERVEREAPGYRFVADPTELDAFRFESLLDDARGNGHGPKESLDLLDEAIELWRGPALADLAQEASLAGEIARLEELRLVAAEERISALLDLGQHADVVAELEAETTAHPLRERLWGQLILALYRSGRQADALAAFDRARGLLGEELGIDPSPELQDLHQRVLRQDESLQPSGQPLRGYRLIEKIGEGAFGSVYRAIQPQVEREVAIKSIHAELANQPDFVRRFEREAQLVARLEHPHIVPLYDYWREPDAAYLIMRFLRGGSLEGVLDAGPLEPERVADLLDQIGAALAVAHQHGVVHRDVKPGNVLLDEQGNAYLTDFGIALKTGAPEQTAGTMIRGTPAYLSPEQIKLDPTSPRSDIYALGVVLYEMLTGEHPFPGTSLNVLLDQHLHQPIPSARAKRPELPPAVDATIARATAKDPEARFADVLELTAAFRDAIGGAHVAVAREARNPYKGLRAFLEADSADFFGRELLTRRLLERVAEPGAPGFLCVVGPSGSGKSSVVRAGLVPAIRRGTIPGSERWFVVELTPGPHPLRELESALLGVSVDPPPSLLDELERDEGGLSRAVERILPEPDAELLIVLDQLEELFTMVESDTERAHLLESLRLATGDPASRIRVVATLRADFFDQPLSVRGFGELLASRNEAITPMSPEELERAIVGPSERVGLDVEPGLVAAMIADVIDRPGALPLLQYALTELADNDDVRALTLNAYRKIGGVSGAIARRAEQLYDGLDEGGRVACRQLFLRLVSIGEGTDDTRHRVRRSELMHLDDAGIDAAIESFGRHRLLSFDRDPDTREPTIEIAHESLLRAWGRLREWIDEARDDVRAFRRLEIAAAEWDASGREDGFLLRGARLEQLSAWADETTIALSPAERTFLEASRARRDEEQRAEEQRRQRERALERRSVRRARSLVAVFAVAALVAGGLTVFALNQSRRAAEEERNAFARELAAESVASLDVDAERSVLLALESIEQTRSVDGTVLLEAEQALHRAVTASRIELTVPGLGGKLDWSPEGVFATEGPEETGMIDIRDAETGEPALPAFQGHDVDVNEVEFSPDGSMLASVGDDGALNVWDPRTGDRISSIEGKGVVLGLSFSADGSLVAASWVDEGVVRIADPSTGRVVRELDRLSEFGDPPGETAISPDGTRIAVANFNYQRVWIYDVGSGRLENELFGHAYPIGTIAWTPDGARLATGGGDGAVRVWDAATGQTQVEILGHTGIVISVEWSPDGRRLLTSGSDGTVRVWEVSEAGARESIRLSSEELRSGAAAVFSPDGDRVMTGDASITAVKIWDVTLDGEAEWANFRSDELAPVDVAFIDDRTVASSVDRGSVAIWNVDDDRHVRTIGPGDGTPEPVTIIDASPDGTRVSTARNFSDVVNVWNVASGEPVADLRPGGEVSAIDTSADNHIVLSTWGPVAAVYDPDGEDVRTIELGEGRYFEDVAFDPSGQVVAAATIHERDPTDSSVAFYDRTGGPPLSEIELDVRPVAIAFDPAGELIAIGLSDGSVDVRDVENGERFARFSAHSAAWSISFSPDGSQIGVGLEDGTVRLFDPDGGRQLILPGHDLVASGLSFSPDGTRLASNAPDGVARVWALDIDDLIDIAKTKVTRDLTDEECRQYLHVARCPTG